MGNCASYGHLLTAEDELTAPYETNEAHPPHALHPHVVKLDGVQAPSCW